MLHMRLSTSLGKFENFYERKHLKILLRYVWTSVYLFIALFQVFCMFVFFSNFEVNLAFTVFCCMGNDAIFSAKK